VEFLPRLLEPLLTSVLASASVTILEGGRATGKSTLCDKLGAQLGWPKRLDLSDPNTIDLVRLDPLGFLASQPTPCVIDEAQLEPNLPVWIKRVVDERRAPGSFLLTGSARLGRNALGGSDPLAGRSIRLRLSSLTESELERRPSDFIDRAFGDGWEAGVDAAVRPQRSPWIGGLPGVSGVLDGSLSIQWEREIATYVESVLPLGAAGSRADLGRLMRTFRYLAANSSQLLNLARAANELGAQAATVRSQIELLEAAFLLTRVEAHRPAEHRVLTAHPRIYASDVGLASWASRAWTGPLSAALFGSLTESAVAHDVIAAADAHAERITVRHWRDQRNKQEVDLLLLHPNGSFVAIEMKASTSVGPDDAMGLRAFAADAGEACVRGVVIYNGDRVVNLSSPDAPTPMVGVPRSLL
jgi:uncharacterized protein